MAGVDLDRALAETWAEWSLREPELVAPPERDRLDMMTDRAATVWCSGGVLVDLGGGLSILNGLLAQLGMEVWVLDVFDYDLGWQERTGDDDATIVEREHALRGLLEDAGVRFVETDLIRTDLRTMFEDGSVDSVGTFHCLEHLHHSPLPLLRSGLDVLSESGVLVIEVPNSVNLLKRLQVLSGRTNYIDYWTYVDAETYSGHVREYSVGDLRTLADRLGASSVEIWGRNWYGSLYDGVPVHALASAVDRVLRLRPGLCGSLFMRVRHDDRPRRQEPTDAATAGSPMSS